MPPAFRRLRVLGAAAMAIGLCFTATSCFFSGKAGKTTCSEYQSLDFTEQSELREDLLREHDLDPYFYDNIAGVEESIKQLLLIVFQRGSPARGRHRLGVLKVVTPLIRRRQLLGALALVGTCLTLTSCTKDEFTIEGTWKSTGDNSWGLMSKGSVVTFADGHTALFSPNDSYAFYEENGTYHPQ